MKYSIRIIVANISVRVLDLNLEVLPLYSLVVPNVEGVGPSQQLDTCEPLLSMVGPELVQLHLRLLTVSAHAEGGVLGNDKVVHGD